MSDYVNKVKKDNTTYDINDARIASPANADVGKVLKVADDLSFEYGEAGGGEPEPTLIDLGADPTLQTLLNYFEVSGSSKDCGYVTLQWSNTGGSPQQTVTGHLTINWRGGLYNFHIDNNKLQKGSYGNWSISGVDETTSNYTETLAHWVDNYSFAYYLCPNTPSDYREKNYVLIPGRAETGPQWSEVSGGGTKLYQHYIELSDSRFVMTVKLYIVTNDSSPITEQQSSGMAGFVIGGKIISYNVVGTCSDNTHVVSSVCSNQGSFYTIECYCLNFSAGSGNFKKLLSYGTLSEFTDTVTAL